MTGMKVKFWGVRGSIPVPGPQTIEVGGNTPCVEVVTAEHEIVVFDAGTGIRALGLSLEKEEGPLSIHLFFSHTHWDHIQGFPFFRPLFDPKNHVTLYGRAEVGRSLDSALAGQMQYQYFPVQLPDLAADIHFVALEEGKIRINDRTWITVREFWHPGGVFSYRVERNGRSLVYATDIEIAANNQEQSLVEFCRDSDLLIMDCQFTSEEYQTKRKGWGHGTPEAAIRLAKAAGVKRLAMFHHEPTHDDEFLKRMEAQAQEDFPETFLARDNMEVEL